MLVVKSINQRSYEDGDVAVEIVLSDPNGPADGVPPDPAFAAGLSEPADVSPCSSPEPTAAAIPPGTLPLVIGIITSIAELLKLFRGRTAAALLALLLLSADATAGPVRQFIANACDRIKERQDSRLARRGCSSGVSRPVAFPAASPLPAAPVTYTIQPVSSCPGGVCPAPTRR